MTEDARERRIRGRCARDASVDAATATAGGGGDDDDWRRPATVVLVRRADDETRAALALVRGRGDARRADGVAAVGETFALFSTTCEGVEV